MKNLATERLGEYWKYKNTDLCFTIIEYINSKEITIEFDDGLIMNNLTYRVIENMLFKLPINKFSPTIYNVGYIGEGKYYFSKKKIKSKEYTIWHSMLRRCYSINKNIEFPAYIGCTVDERWYNFQVFAEWFNNNYIDGYHLDKDILIKGNKVYGPDTCCFVPSQINSLFTNQNRYNTNKEYKNPVGLTESDNGYIASLSLGNGNTLSKWFKNQNDAENFYKENKKAVLIKIVDEYKNFLSEKIIKAILNYEF